MAENQAQAGMAWQGIARCAYQAYAASTGNKNYQGLPMPEFDDLPQKIQTAWEAAVRHAKDVTVVGPENADPSRWDGWIPPHVLDHMEGIV